jgi:hypothetical protein
MDGSILLHTRFVADQLAHEFRGDPEGELEIWATTAQQREAMVVMLYDAAAIERRLPKHPDWRHLGTRALPHDARRSASDLGRETPHGGAFYARRDRGPRDPLCHRDQLG